MPREWNGGKAKIRTALLAALTALTITGCAAIESIFSPPPPPKTPVSSPPPPVRKEPAVPPTPRKEPETPPTKKEPEALPTKNEPEAPPTKKEPETPPAKKESPPPPAKKESPPPPAKKEPVAPPSKKEPEVPPMKKEPESPPAGREPEASPPVLAPQVGDEEQLKREAGSRIQRTEQLVAQLEDKKLTNDQKEQLLTIQSLLGNAKEALATRDLAKASNLADKARVLAEELARGVRQ